MRCHTKRIKCLGGIPCRNCALSSSSCIFTPTKRGQLPTEQSQDLPSSSTFRERASSTTSYRRPEKDFRSSRSAASRDGTGSVPNYHGNPSDTAFVDQFVSLTAAQRSSAAIHSFSVFDSAWNQWDASSQDPADIAIEITIDSDSIADIRRSNDKPAKLRLPPYNHSLYLLQNLEQTISKEQHLIRRRYIRNRLNQMYQNPVAESKDHGWLCYWLAILALGEIYSGSSTYSSNIEDSSITSTGNSLGADYYAQSVALLQQVADSPDVQFVETLCVLTICAFALNKVNTAYMFVGISLRAALSLDLHRDPLEIPSKRSNLSNCELEHQKRLFWTVYYQDL